MSKLIIPDRWIRALQVIPCTERVCVVVLQDGREIGYTDMPSQLLSPGPVGRAVEIALGDRCDTIDWRTLDIRIEPYPRPASLVRFCSCSLDVLMLAGCRCGGA